MILIVAEGEPEALSLITALHTAADVEDLPDGDRMAARRWRRQADSLSDQLEAVTRDARVTAARSAGQREGGPSERLSVADPAAG